MQIEKSPSPKQIAEFCIILAYCGLYQPDELYKVVCPFHADVNASMQINIPQCFFWCYAECGAGGSTLELYKAQMALKGKHPTDMEALFAIKKITKEYQRKGKSNGPEGNSLYVSDKYTTYTNITNKNLSSIPLLKSKVNYREGINQARDFYFNLPTTNWYRPGMDEGTEAKRYMKHRGFTAKILTKYGAKVTYNKYYPIVFPLFESGVFRGYVMRTFDEQIASERKYMYNRGFKRERTLPGEFKSETVLLVEGYLDKLKANQLGFENVVAILGWKITATHLNKLKRAGVKKIICGTDNDDAGKKGWKYLKRICHEKGFLLKRLRYPKGIGDMGDIKQGTHQEQLVSNQLKLYGLF